MKITKKLLLLLILFPLQIKAQCTNQEITRYKSLSTNIDSYYDYDESQNKFNITVYNLSNELNIKNTNDNTNYTSNETIGETKINNIEPGTRLTIAVYPKNDNCKDYRTRTIYINLPYHNKYYKDEICNNNNSILCSKWTNTNNYTREQFIETVKTEKQEEIEVQEPEPEIKKYGIFDFLGDFYIYILLFIIISGSTAIYFLDKKSKFNFDV